MANHASIIAFAGSTRSASVNRKLIAIAAAGARAVGGEVTLLELRDHPLPVYDLELEAAEGLPANAVRLRRIFKAHRGLLIAVPEHNQSLPAVLKNVIDWVSRPAEGDAPLACFAGKAAALVSASSGAMGGLRAQAHLRQILGGIGVTLLPQNWAVQRANAGTFDERGDLRDPTAQSMVVAVGAELTRFLQGLAD